MMSTDADRQIANMDGEAALPRSNGELVFQAPWEGRAFGIAVAMNEDGLYSWREFRDRLVEEIAAVGEDATGATYYEQWLASLEKLAIQRGFVTPEEMDARTEEYASGERDDDHDDDHDDH